MLCGRNVEREGIAWLSWHSAIAEVLAVEMSAFAVLYNVEDKLGFCARQILTANR